MGPVYREEHGEHGRCRGARRSPFVAVLREADRSPDHFAAEKRTGGWHRSRVKRTGGWHPSLGHPSLGGPLTSAVEPQVLVIPCLSPVRVKTVYAASSARVGSALARPARGRVNTEKTRTGSQACLTGDVTDVRNENRRHVLPELQRRPAGSSGASGRAGRVFPRRRLHDMPARVPGGGGDRGLPASR